MAIMDKMPMVDDDEDINPLGFLTAPMTTFMEYRGWDCRGTYDGRDLVFDYPRSFGGSQNRMNMLTLGDLFLNTLDCRFVLTRRGFIRARIITCGVQGGCPEHESKHFSYNPGPGRSLTRLLNELEFRSTRVDLATVTHCVIFGDCGRWPRPGEDFDDASPRGFPHT